MGIFANKQYNSITGELEGTIKGYQKLADKKNIPLPPSPKEQPKKGLLAKVGSFLSAFETAPAVEAALRGDNPFTAYKESVKRGLKTQEDITTKTSYSNILEEQGWKSTPGTGSLRESATWKNFAKEIVGLAGDIALDPTTYLTFGLGKGAALETKAGAKVLSKTGEKVLQNTAKESSKVIGEQLAKKGIQKTEQELVEAGIKQAERKILNSTNKKLFDQGGIKFGGKTLISDEILKKPIEKTKTLLSKSDTGLKLLDGMNKIKTSVGKLFYRDFGLDERYVADKQKYLDGFNADAEDIVNTLQTTFKGTNDAEREAISLAIEKNDFTGLSERGKFLAQKSQDLFKDIAKEEERRGLLDSTLDSYVTHIYKDRKKAQEVLNFLNGGVRGGETRFAKERVIPTIEEAEKLGLQPEKDVAKILAARLMASQKAIREQDLLQVVAKKFGVPKKNLGLDKLLGEDLVEYTNKEFNGLLVPKNIAEDLANISKKTIDDEAMNTFLRGYDAVQNFFKGSVTSIFPAFHGRNFLSNVAQNALDIGVQAINPIKNLRAINVLRKNSKGILTTKFGKQYTYEELRKIMKEFGILGSPGSRDVVETVGQKLEKGLKKIKQANPFSVGRSVGNVIEDHARSLNFLSNLEKGLSLEQAAKKTKQFLFDYANLSNFEKTVMKRAIPFYTWTRKNVELQVKTALTRPGIIGAELKAQRLGPQETQKERQSLPEYIAEGLAIKTGNKNGLVQYLTGLGLPIENALQNLPQGISRKEMMDYLNKVASQGAFVPKYIAELATGHEFFRNKPIKDLYNASEYAKMPDFLKNWLELKEKKVDYNDKKTGKRVKYTQYIANPYKLHLLRSLPTSRLVGTVGGVLDENQSTLGKLLKYTTGIKIYPIDVQKMQEKELKDYIREVEDTLTNYGVLGEFTKTFVPKEDKKKSILRN